MMKWMGDELKDSIAAPKSFNSSPIHFIIVVMSGLVCGHAETLLIATAFLKFSINLSLFLSIAANNFCNGSGVAIITDGWILFLSLVSWLVFMLNPIWLGRLCHLL